VKIKKEKVFFSEEKKQKTSIPGSYGIAHLSGHVPDPSARCMDMTGVWRAGTAPQPSFCLERLICAFSTATA
jgi:hypothetical protein